MSSFVYCIKSGAQRTYVGATKDLRRRIRQHNGEIKGGAKSTRGGNWTYLFHCEGFESWRQALSFEWHLKHVRKYRRGQDPVSRRWKCVNILLNQDRWDHVRLVPAQCLDGPRVECPEAEGISTDTALSPQRSPTAPSHGLSAPNTPPPSPETVVTKETPGVLEITDDDCGAFIRTHTAKRLHLIRAYSATSVPHRVLKMCCNKEKISNLNS